MPAFFLLIRIKKFVIPILWFPIWLLLLPFVLLAYLISPFFYRTNYRHILQNSYIGWLLLVKLHGLKVDINSKNDDRIYLSFV